MNYNNNRIDDSSHKRPIGRLRQGDKLANQRRQVISTLASLGRSQFDQRLAEFRRSEELAAADATEEAEHRYYESLVFRLHQIEEAFEKVDAGAYGSCARCSREIGKKRLEADPSVSLCVECQGALESASQDLQPTM